MCKNNNIEQLRLNPIHFQCTSRNNSLFLARFMVFSFQPSDMIIFGMLLPTRAPEKYRLRNQLVELNQCVFPAARTNRTHETFPR